MAPTGPQDRQRGAGGSQGQFRACCQPFGQTGQFAPPTAREGLRPISGLHWMTSWITHLAGAPDTQGSAWQHSVPSPLTRGPFSFSETKATKAPRVAGQGIAPG